MLATNLGGSGNNSDIITFTVNGKTKCNEADGANAIIFLLPHSSHYFSGPSYPPQLLSVGVGANSTQFFGNETQDLQDLSISEPGPTTVDTIGRTVYWYSCPKHLICSQSLHSGSPQVNPSYLKIS